MNPLQMIQEYQKFRKAFEEGNPGMNPQQFIQKLLNEGKVNPQMVEQARAMAQIVGVKL